MKTILIWLLLGSATFAQVDFTTMPGANNDEKIANALTEAKRIAVNGRNAYITAPPGIYRFKIPWKFDGIGWYCPGGLRSVVAVFDKQEPGNVLVSFVGGYGQTVEGLSVRAALVNGRQVENLVAFKFSHVSGLSARNLEARLTGQNGIGFLINDESPNQNTESCRFENLAAVCSMPMHFYSGDNCQFLNIDFTCKPQPSANYIWAGIQGGPITTLGSVRFNGTIQRGNHAMYFNTEFASGTKGNGDIGVIDNVRYEQQIVNPNAPAAWVFRFRHLKNGQKRNGQESLLMLGCRNTPRPNGKSTHIEGVQKFESVGSILHGSPVN